MNIEAHLACGWVLAQLGGNETRRFRGLVTLAAIAPDMDTLSYFWGTDAYANIHHALGRFKWTPLEFISPELDCRVVNLFRQKPLKCGICERSANETCSLCYRPVCMRHGRITRRFLIICKDCQSHPAPASQ